ncbi:hypothetical protein OB236_05320 [Paenibacillus sp. WQ 127069]|uniref:Uncharacterized protein n=1 Tax=Paenibacillus baimaensis TaxID=2982185 RepID=A0ABT2UA76_9BACL|nr:hypothetical protein [Paenibacillus sp. WQ 127069]MCU6791548.1 hypothetical protein [Paenibacillus sp. WQ 127069]
MSKTMQFITNEVVSQDEFFEWVLFKGKEIQELSSGYKQVLFMKNEAVVWLYYRGDNKDEYDSDELSFLKNKYNIIPNTSIAIDVGNKQGSEELAFNICFEILSSFKYSVVDDSYGNFYNFSEMSLLECNLDGNWKTR